MFSLSINTISHLIAPSLRPAQYSPFSHSPSFSEESYALTVRALLEAASVLNLLRRGGEFSVRLLSRRDGNRLKISNWTHRPIQHEMKDFDWLVWVRSGRYAPPAPAALVGEVRSKIPDSVLVGRSGRRSVRSQCCISAGAVFTLILQATSTRNDPFPSKRSTTTTTTQHNTLRRLKHKKLHNHPRSSYLHRYNSRADLF